MIKIIQGNCIDKLKELEDESVQCVVTSPPYWGLRDYGTATWEGGDENCDHLGEKHQTRTGFNERYFNIKSSENNKQDALHTPYKSICKKCGAKRIDDQLGLEKTPQEYVQSLVNVFREVKRVLRNDGTVWLNLGDSYSEKDLVGIPWRVAFALQDDGWYLRQDIIWAKPNPMPESVQDRCTKSHEYIFLLTKKPKYYYDAEAIKEEAAEGTTKREKYQRTGYSKEKHMDGFINYLNPNIADTHRKSNGRVNKRDVWTITTKPYSDAHFATFPTEIPEICIKASSKEGDTVLDMFAGAGTTGLVADRLGRDAILIELNKDYADMLEKRIYNDAPMFVEIETFQE